MNHTIKRYCYYPHKRPYRWWWKLLGPADEIIADGFSSKAEACQWASERGLALS